MHTLAKDDEDQAKKALRWVQRLSREAWQRDGAQGDGSVYDDVGLHTLACCLGRYDSTKGASFVTYVRCRVQLALLRPLDYPWARPFASLTSCPSGAPRVPKWNRWCSLAAMVRVGGVLVCLVLGSCASQVRDPPALPDTSMFVPPQVAAPAPPPPVILQARIIPVDIPPVDAEPQERPKGKKRQQRWRGWSGERDEGALVPVARMCQTDKRNALLRCAYRTGAIYEVRTSPDHATTFVLPPTIRIAMPPVLDVRSSQEGPEEKGQQARWDIVFGEVGSEETRQELILIRPVYIGTVATTQFITKSGHFFLVRLISQEKPGVLAVTWDLPMMPKRSMTDQEEAAQSRAPKIALDRLHIGYKLEPGKTKVPWMPMETYDDGSVTVIHFAESLKFTSAPILVAAEGTKTYPVEYTAYAVPGHPEKGEFYVTKGLYPRLQLRDGHGGVVTILRQEREKPVYEEVR